ncbi:MAG: transcription initiation factor IIB [Candidatus Thorarchaeota archaeon]|nr:MAG: transcription initiation factor IIB [Candidatus Thorarchaeota archaeon]
MARPVRAMADRQHGIQVCSICGNSEFYEDQTRGEFICTSCGCVMDERIMDTGPEWRAFTAEERNARARTGSPQTLTMADKGLATTLGWSDRDANGRAIAASNRAAIYRMRKWQIRTLVHSSQHRNLSIAMSELDRLTSQLGVPSEAKETAALIYRKALSRRLVRGRSIEGMVAAAIYLSCRIHRIPRQLDEVVTEARVNRKELGQCVRLILRNVRIKVPIPSANDLMPRISADLGLDGRTVQKAMEIINMARERGITAGKDPGGLAAAALYIAGIITNDRRTQREIAEASNVTEVTVRNRYKDLANSLKITIRP